MFENPTQITEIPESFVALKARLLRNKILQDTVDRVNPIRYATLSDSQRTEIAEYRQALLDVPTQSGFPTTISWPSQPSWL
jgi:hypothetical protein